MAATLTEAMKADLGKGHARLALIDYASTGVDFSTAIDFSTADQLWTVQDSLKVTSDDPTRTDLKLDQYKEVYDSDIEDGDYGIEGNVPFLNQPLFDMFFNDAKSGVSVTGTEGTSYTGSGYTTPKDVEKTILIESESKKTAIVLAHVKLRFNPPQIDDSSTSWYTRFTGSVLTNPAGPKFVVLHQETTTTGA